MILFEKKNKHGEFQDILGQSIDTGDKFLNKKLNANLAYGKGGGGGSAPQDVPKTLQPYVTEVLDRASDIYAPSKGYVPYAGERIVGFSAPEQAAQQGIQGMVSRGISASPGLTSAGTYYAPALGLLGQAGQMGQQAAQDITMDEIQGRMSPYQQAVTDIAKREAMKEAQLYQQQLAAQGAQTGAFGGSRQALLESQAVSDLGGRLSDIQAKGSQAAYMDAIRMAEAQRARQSEGSQLATGLSQAFGALGQQALGQGYREQGYLSGVGEQQRGMEQQRADLAYQEFVQQRDYPQEQLQRYSSLIQGFPYQISNSSLVQQPSQFQQAAGGIATIGGLGRGLGFFNQGGKIGSKGLSGVVNAAIGGDIQALIDQRKALMDEINRRNEGRQIPSAQRALKQQIAEIDSQLQTLTPTVTPKPDSIQQQRATARRGPPGRKTGLSSITPTPDEQVTPAEDTSPAQAAAGNLVETANQTAGYQTTLADLGERFGGVGTTEAQKKGLAAYEELSKLIDASTFDKAAREKEINERMEAAKSQGGFDLAALGLQLMSTPAKDIDPNLVRNLGTSKKEIAALKAEIAKLPEEERAQGMKNALTKITGLSSLSELLPDALDAPAFTPQVVAGAVELATQGMGKSFSQNMLEKEGIKIGKLATDVQEDIDNLQIKDENTRNAAYVQALADKIRDEINEKGLINKGAEGTGSTKGRSQSNQGKFIPRQKVEDK